MVYKIVIKFIHALCKKHGISVGIIVEVDRQRLVAILREQIFGSRNKDKPVFTVDRDLNNEIRDAASECLNHCLCAYKSKLAGLRKASEELNVAHNITDRDIAMEVPFSIQESISWSAKR